MGWYFDRREWEWYCEDCDRRFQYRSSLSRHLRESTWHNFRSAAHESKTMRCPMKGCFHVFASLSALALHLDAQKCPGGVTREQIDRYIIQHDLRGLISNRGRMITRGTLNASYKPPAIYKATELAWNGSAYQCYFCPITFRTLGELDWHLASPKHSNGTVNGGKIYRCPNTGNCGKQFSTLSGAVQHIERGNCGILKIRGVKDTMEGLMYGFKRLAF